MILTIEFRAAGDRWRVRVAETGYTRDEPNRMGYNARGHVASLGGHGGDITDMARVVPIYRVAGFNPVETAGAVYFYTRLAHQEVRRGLAHILDLFDRYDLVLELPGYHEIAAGVRAAFEKELYQMTYVRSYSINGRKKKLPWNLFRWR